MSCLKRQSKYNILADSRTRKEYCCAYLVMTKAPGSELLTDLIEEQLLTYPLLPLSDEIISVISDLPPGFAYVALDGEVSHEVMWDIMDLGVITASIREGNPPVLAMNSPLTAIAGRVFDHFVSPMSMLIERYLLQGLLAFTLQLEVEFSHITHTAGSNTVQTWMRAFPAWSSFPQTRNHDSLLWSLLCFVGASELFIGQQGSTDDILDRLIVYPAFPHEWETIEEVLKRFLWTDTLLQRWRVIWETAVTRRQQALKQGRIIKASREIVPTTRQHGYRVPVAATCSMISFIMSRRGVPIQQ